MDDKDRYQRLIALLDGDKGKKHDAVIAKIARDYAKSRLHETNLTAEAYARRNDGEHWSDLFEEYEPRWCRADVRQTELAKQAASTQATTLRGVTYKLIIWRWEAVAQSGDVGFDARHDLFAFGAYLDLLRLAELNELAHQNDGAA
ncbi:MAG: hypothetical protein NW206_08385 [Hyphomonadaceae bacterium]|nr:hypothetical protein [Hyphomonadaceae bacterium]